MRIKKIFTFGLTVFMFIAVYLYYVLQNGMKNINDNINNTDDSMYGRKQADVKKEENEGFYADWNKAIHLAVVVCGNRVEEALVLLKSAVLFTQRPLVVHIFAEMSCQRMLQHQLVSWPERYVQNMQYLMYNVTFPERYSTTWKELYKPCCTQRLFIPSVLKDVDSILYVDTDVIFFRGLGEIWKIFDRFNSTQLAALAPETEDASLGWYNRWARHPYYGELGLNSGVMLMNLTRIRRSKWLESFLEYYNEYKLKIAWGDQDLINIYFHFHPEQLYTTTCEWNYREDHCMCMNLCKGTERTGISVLHGSRRTMQNNKQPAFKAVYRAFKEHEFSSGIKSGLLKSLKDKLSNTSSTLCGKLGPIIYTKHIEDFVQNANSWYWFR